VIAPRTRLRILSGPEIYDAALQLGQDELVWVDMADPHPRELSWLEQTFGFHQLALEDVALEHQRPKLDTYPGYYFGVLYAVRIHPQRRRASASELQFFWGHSYLVTIHRESFPEIDELESRARDGLLTPIVKSAQREFEIPDLVYRLIDAVVDGYFPAVDALLEWTDDIEERLFSSDRSPEMLQGMFGIRRDLIQLRKVVAPSREVINVMLRRHQDLFGDEFYAYFQDVYDHTVRVIDSLDTCRDLLSSALETYLTVLSNDVNQTVKKMTAVTAILMVNSLIAGIYGMNFEYMPELAWRFGYVWALGLMVVSSFVLWRVLKRIRWL
jgi:magnesium transporter